jgi:excinuclease ABC subunit C
VNRKKKQKAITLQRLRALPKSPGVYLMKNSKGEVLYVGKAKSLRSRVSSYFHKGDDRYNVQFLLEQVSNVDTLVTEDERQAIILESDLIKKYKPRYNVRLKDDKAYLIVRVDLNHEWPCLELTRVVKNDGARYFGPFAFSYELRTLLETIKRSVTLRTCSDKILYNRVRPCLEYQIKRCAGPCCLDVDHVQYLSWVDQAMSILSGNTEEVVRSLSYDMQKASEDLRFEDAALIRDRLQVLQRIGEDKKQVQFAVGATDAFGLYREGDKAELSVLMVRQGRLFEAKTFGFEDVEVGEEEILGSLLTQYYGGSSVIPELIVLPFELEDQNVREELYSDKAEAKVTFAVPQRGDKARLLVLAQRNAKENFEARFSDLNKTDRVLRGLQKEFSLEQTPRTIECVDISHFQGAATVASVVAFEDMKANKTRYRHFHLSQEGKADDFASMREVTLRHLSRGAEENTLPDLFVVDGGPAQLAQALAVRKELGLSTPAMVGLAKERVIEGLGGKSRAYAIGKTAKKPERVYVEGKSTPIVLSPASEVLQLLQRIRDEAHRFAITFHRETRSKRTFKSALDQIPGVGPARKLGLLREFQSVKAIKNSSPEEISTRCRIPLPLAQRIVEFLGRDEP